MYIDLKKKNVSFEKSVISTYPSSRSATLKVVIFYFRQTCVSAHINLRPYLDWKDVICTSRKEGFEHYVINSIKMFI